MGLKYNSDKFESCLNTFRGLYSNPAVDEYQGSVMIPLDFSLEMDGISGIIPHSAFEIPKDSLPKSYLTKKGESRIVFILHSIDHNVNNNKWTTKITGQTLNIRFDELTEAEKEAIKKAQTPAEVSVKTLTEIIQNQASSIIEKGVAVTTADQEKYMKMVYKGLLTAGFNSNQSKFLVAEIGRENGFNPNILFAFHDDPKRGYNAGMISWQGERKEKLISDLQKQGLSLGKVPPTEQEQQRLITAMARYIIWEIRNDPKYQRTRKKFLENPNVTNETAIEVLGNNYIRWRLTDPKYREKGLKNRALFLNKINKLYP